MFSIQIKGVVRKSVSEILFSLHIKRTNLCAPMEEERRKEKENNKNNGQVSTLSSRDITKTKVY